jgi:hypothetical protein
MSWWSRAFPKPTHGATVERRLHRVSPRPIAGFSGGGVVCIAGTVDPLEALVVAPLTGRPCVYWALTVSEVTFMLATFELANLDGGAPFLLVDGPSTARVIPDGAHVSSVPETRLRSLLPPHPSRSWGAIAAEPPLMSREERALFDSVNGRIAPKSRVRFTEYVIEPEAVVFVRGSSDTEPDPQAAELGYRDSPSRPVLASARRTPLLIRVLPGRSSVQVPPAR